MRTKLKNMMSGKVVDKTFNAGVKVDVANVDRREMQYLYREGDDFVFMDMTTTTSRGCRRPWSATGRTSCSRTRPSRWPSTRAPPVRRPAGRGRAADRPDRPRPAGRPVHRRHKPATLETGATVQVPLFIPPGRRSRSTPATASTSAALTSGRSHKARKRALDILFEAEQRGSRSAGAGGPLAGQGQTRGNPYTADLVRGVTEHTARIDELI